MSEFLSLTGWPRIRAQEPSPASHSQGKAGIISMPQFVCLADKKRYLRYDTN